ncbi:MAG TPA: hypothetical protein VG294_00460 [Solirubrobacteraceae bacterium]|nr:hypothetical protein [Solirubrobacteraceae bacterium]
MSPGLINAVPGRVRISLDVRGPADDAVQGVIADVVAFAERAAAAGDFSAEYRQRQTVPATRMDERIGPRSRLWRPTGEPFTTMISGAAHDTMCVADRVPTAMVFVPCRDGLSHTPVEDANPADAALGAEIMLGAIHALAQERTAA